jgi:hypothetical protein
MKTIKLTFVLLITICVSLTAQVGEQIEIANAADLQKIGNDEAYPLNGNYVLTADIDLAHIEDWIPIGALSVSDGSPRNFNGVLNGNGYSIKNLKITTSTNFKGLFGRLYHATVQDLDLVNVNIVGMAPTGGVTGAMIGESIIERVSVSGNIIGDSQIGGIVGRIARDPTNPGYNIIRDCYVTADVTATKRTGTDNTNDISNLSVAGGIAALSHSIQNGNCGKIDIRRCYVTGSIISEENQYVTGNAAGILTFYDGHYYVKMEECIVLCDTIGAATSNLFFSRKGPTYDQFELFRKVYARTGIELYYVKPSDPGRGGQIHEGIIQYNPLETYKTKQFYADSLTWDFENVWTMEEGALPVLKRTNLSTQIVVPNASKNCKISVKAGVLEIEPCTTISVHVFDITGSKVYAAENLGSKIHIDNMPEGIYIVKTQSEHVKNVEKVLLR